MNYSLLESIHSPADVKGLSRQQLPQLAREMRHYMIETLAPIGGHLGAGLGVVELSIALHYLYNTPEEEIEARGIRRLPRNLMLAINALKEDELSDKVMGPVMKKSYLAYKNDEWERYHQAVTDWEVQEYLRLY